MPRKSTKPRLSGDDRLVLVRAKIERAKQNLVEMERILIAGGDYVPGLNMYVQSRKRPPGQFLTYHVSFDVLTAAGDVVNNLRGALDHLAYQMTIAHRPRTSQRELKGIYFPICKDKPTYEKAAKGYKKFFGAEAIKLLDTLKPYKGGNEALFRLHDLNNFSKHRLLLTMERYVICSAPWHTRNGVPVRYMLKFGHPQFNGIFARPKVKDYILRGSQETISELRSGRREALLPTLRYLVQFVDSIIKPFARVM